MDTLTTAFACDIERLLSPISTDEPAGQSLRYEGTYDRVAELRREDDPTLERGVWTAEPKRADWAGVAETCIVAIATRSKDIQLAAWLLEAWIHLHGFAGLREGLRVIAALCDTYWDALHPQIEDGDLEFRLAPFYWMDDKLSVALKLIPLTAPQADDFSPYTLADWELATRHRPARSRAAADDVITAARFEQSLTLTPTRALSQTAVEIEGSLATLEEARRVLVARCAEQAPSLSGLREGLRASLGVIVAGLKTRGEAHAAPVLLPRTMPRPSTEPLPEPGTGDRGSIRTRAEAYLRLAEAAEFLARTEPHSPVPHLVRRAIAWGGMNLEELLPELVDDAKQIQGIYRMLQLGDKLQH